MRRNAWLSVVGAAAGLLVGASESRGQCQTWSTEFGNSLSGKVYALQPFNDGSGPKLWVAGDCGLPGVPQSYGVVRWNGSGWLITQLLDDTPLCLGVHDDGTGASLYVGGYFAQGIRRWNGSSWVSVGFGLSDQFHSAVVMALSTFTVGGSSSLYAGGVAFWTSESIARWDGQTWSSVGQGVTGPNPRVTALHVFDDGSGPALYVGGTFSTAGGVPVDGLARWNGSQWSAVGSNAHHVAAFATFDDGTGPALYASGTFFIPPGYFTYFARWTGSTWVDVPHPFANSGNVLAVGNDGGGPMLFDGDGPNEISKWDGHNWLTMGDGLNGGVSALDFFDEGLGHGPELFVGGQFTLAGGGIQSRGIAKWITCSDAIESFCPGDSTLAQCPCQNSGQPGRGCNNSASTGGAQLSASGTTTPDTVVLTSSFELPSALSIFLQGDAVTQFVQPFGDGLRCVGGQLHRLYVKTAQAGTATAPGAGDQTISGRSGTLGDPLLPGTIRFYQVYYRDPSTSFCTDPTGGTFNVSNGVRVVW
jgi:hypothetical protein